MSDKVKPEIDLPDDVAELGKAPKEPVKTPEAKPVETKPVEEKSVEAKTEKKETKATVKAETKVETKTEAQTKKEDTVGERVMILDATTNTYLKDGEKVASFDRKDDAEKYLLNLGREGSYKFVTTSRVFTLKIKATLE